MPTATATEAKAEISSPIFHVLIPIRHREMIDLIVMGKKQVQVQGLPRPILIPSRHCLNISIILQDQKMVKGMQMWMWTFHTISPSTILLRMNIYLRRYPHPNGSREHSRRIQAQHQCPTLPKIQAKT
jgi:hypothetical protein